MLWVLKLYSLSTRGPSTTTSRASKRYGSELQMYDWLIKTDTPQIDTALASLAVINLPFSCE